jgi:lipopolysaccharide/colanic/teichoic acid biosynthesis glycosyltransferase
MQPSAVSHGKTEDNAITNDTTRLSSAVSEQIYFLSAEVSPMNKTAAVRVMPEIRHAWLKSGKISVQHLSLSSWTMSAGKRIFDCVSVLLVLPLVLPLLAITALLVRLTSSGPVLFVQERVGLHGKTFLIFKFRSMEHLRNKKRNAVTTADNQRFTPVGPFIRRFKLDELPQIFNVLKGDMSLVGPRPKMEEHVKHDLPCRPGITGYATLTFAREEAVFSRLPKEELEGFYHDVVLPTKHNLDEEYMAGATFCSDFVLILKTVLRRWDTSLLEQLVEEHLQRSRKPKLVRSERSGGFRAGSASPDFVLNGEFSAIGE